MACPGPCRAWHPNWMAQIWNMNWVILGLPVAQGSDVQAEERRMVTAIVVMASWQPFFSGLPGEPHALSCCSSSSNGHAAAYERRLGRWRGTGKCSGPEIGNGACSYTVARRHSVLLCCTIVVDQLLSHSLLGVSLSRNRSNHTKRWEKCATRVTKTQVRKRDTDPNTPGRL